VLLCALLPALLLLVLMFLYRLVTLLTSVSVSLLDMSSLLFGVVAGCCAIVHSAVIGNVGVGGCIVYVNVVVFNAGVRCVVVYVSCSLRVLVFMLSFLLV